LIVFEYRGRRKKEKENNVPFVSKGVVLPRRHASRVVELRQIRKCLKPFAGRKKDRNCNDLLTNLQVSFIVLGQHAMDCKKKNV